MKKLKVFLLLILTIFTVGTSVRPVQANFVVDGWERVRDTAIFIGDVFTSGQSVLELITDAAGENVMQMMRRMIDSIIAIPISWVCPQCLDPEGKLVNSDLPYGQRYGLIGITDNQIVSLFNNQPRIDVLAHLSEEWVPGYRESRSVYALNTGYQDLLESGIGNIWNFTRNIAYLGFVLVMIVIGFMIMFRSKIGGQVMVTIGNSLPRIVISLILVTFSFAIIGLIFDVAGFATTLIHYMLAQDLDRFVRINNLVTIIGGTMGTEGGTYVLGSLLAWIVSMIVGPIGMLFGGATSLNLLVMFVMLIILVIGALKLWFTLVKTYLILLLNTVLAPLAILVGALPGNEVATINIFKTILRNALVFPLAFAIVNIPKYLVDTMEIELMFPESITRTSSILDLNQTVGIGSLLGGVLSIMALYIAAKAPEYMKAVIPPSQPKGGVDLGAVTKESLSKMPILGKRIFKTR